MNGDPHGQAPMLWIASVLLGAGAGQVEGLRTPATSKLFEKRVDPVSGVVSYALSGGTNENRQSIYFTCKSMTDDGRFLLFDRSEAETLNPKASKHKALIDFLKDELVDLPGTDGAIPFVDVKDDYMVAVNDRGFFKRDFRDPLNEIKLCEAPAEVTRLGRVRSWCTHLTLTTDRKKAFIESRVVTPAGATNYVQGLVELATGKYESWGTTEFYCNHGQLNPARDDLAMCAWEECWMGAGKAYREKTGFYPRMWLVRPDGTRTLVPAREKNSASHEIWDDDGAGFSWCGGGVYHHDLASDKQECWVPDAQARHNMLTPDKKYVVYDVAPGKWWRGCPWNVKFYNRETKRTVEVYSTRPALFPESRPSRLHPDPHPQFVCKGRYVVSTANTACGTLELFVTPVDQLVALTTKPAPSESASESK